MLTKWLGHFLFDQVWLISFLTKYYISRFNRNNYWTKPPSIMNLTRPGLLTSPKHIFFYILFISQFDIFIFSYSYFHIHTFLELLKSSYQYSIFIIHNSCHNQLWNTRHVTGYVSPPKMKLFAYNLCRNFIFQNLKKFCLCVKQLYTTPN